MKYSYKTTGTCSTQIDFEVIDNKVYNVVFTRGCNGNTQGVSKLCEGRDRDKLISLLKGINCHNRGTSCPDQLAKALENSK